MRNPIQQRRRRKAAQIERLYRCQEKFCNRSYGTEGALKMHIKLKHPSVTYNENYQLQARRAAAILNQKLLEDDEDEEDSFEDPKFNHYPLDSSDSHYNRLEEDEELQFEIFGNHFPTSKKAPSLTSPDADTPAHLLAPLEFNFKKSDGFEKLNLPQIDPPHAENPQKLKRSLSELCQMSNSKRLKSDPPTFESSFPKSSHNASTEYDRYAQLGSTVTGFQFSGGLPPTSSDSHRNENTAPPSKPSSIQSFQQSFRVPPQENKTINPMQIHYLV
uniref:C2H2-type domain-containing protein n=1 Tax=Arcella intermedia TaxID=1963864 RepID=A0A6B2LCF7_9EUKA